MLDNENMPDGEKTKIRKKLNLAMTNVLEYGQRRSRDIILSLQDKKIVS